MTAGFQALVADQCWKSMLVVGEVPGHLQRTAEVPFSKEPNPKMLRAPVWGSLLIVTFCLMHVNVQNASYVCSTLHVFAIIECVT